MWVGLFLNSTTPIQLAVTTATIEDLPGVAVPPLASQRRGVMPPSGNWREKWLADALQSPNAVDEAARPMIDWLNSVPPGDLAAELMAGFGSGDSLDGYTVVNWLFELHGYPGLRLNSG
jgi:hypothetical protein